MLNVHNKTHSSRVAGDHKHAVAQTCSPFFGAIGRCRTCPVNIPGHNEARDIATSRMHFISYLRLIKNMRGAAAAAKE